MAKRRDINALKLDGEELSNYIHAINKLRERSRADPDDPTGYDFQAAIHNDGFVGPCEHGNDLFLPWHRAHLHYFEKLLQKSDPPRTASVTIPYWDWIHPEAHGKFPAAFSLNGLAMPRSSASAQLPSDTLEIVTQEKDWNAFGGYPQGSPMGDYGRLELGPHNDMHGMYIGGAMASPARAAEDAIYWSFHAFIDLLWSEWQRRNGSPGPTSPDHDLRGFTTQPHFKVADFQDTIVLGYEYEYSEKLALAFEASQPGAPTGRTFIGADRLAPLFTSSLREALAGTEQAAGFQLPSPAQPLQMAVVRINSLKIPTQGSYRLKAYVHPSRQQFRKDDPDFEKRFGVGYVSLWLSHNEHHGHGGHAGHTDHGSHEPPRPLHPTSCTVRFDVSRIVSPLSPERVRDLILTLHYMPAPLPDGQTLSGAEALREVQLEEVILEGFVRA